MISNLEKYEKEVKALLNRGNLLMYAVNHEENPAFHGQIKKQLGDKAESFIKGLPNFTEAYQSWYSEAKAVIRQLLPDRLEDFSRLYEKPKTRREITFENYVIEDALHGLRVTRGYAKEEVVGPSAAIPRVRQQVSMVEAVEARFASSLYDIRQLVQADLFDSELDAAGHLLRNKFGRAAGALAGVVLEKHLGDVCSAHAVTVRKKDPAISDLNEALKAASVIDIPQWRFIQHLADIRNLCDHNKKTEPTAEQVGDLLAGVAKVTKTIF